MRNVTKNSNDLRNVKKMSKLFNILNNFENQRIGEQQGYGFCKKNTQNEKRNEQ